MPAKKVQNLPNINNQLSSRDLFGAFKRQLAKDFQQSNFPFDFVDALEPNYGHIHEKIAFVLQGSEKKKGFTVMQLFNRIDISEAQLKRYLSESSTENHFDVIAEIIIKRVLQKVVIKQHYKSNDAS